MKNSDILSLSCPIPHSDYPTVTMAHGGGGRLMNNLIEKMFLESFNNPALNERHDGAILEITNGKTAFTTDSYVVNPLFFPGGDIGSLAVYGTVNDLAMCGARPVALSAGFIIEEGFAMETLWRIVCSMAKAAELAHVAIVTGDTKVVDRGKGDGIYINTAGVGVVKPGIDVSPARVKPGDDIILSGDIGRHGMAVMAVRENLQFESEIESDLAPLSGPVAELLELGIDIHCMRDLTRGGLASALNEISGSADVSMIVEEKIIPVRDDVHAACEILGFDPLYVANEGRFVIFVSESETDRVMECLSSFSITENSVVIGKVTSSGDVSMVTMKTEIGAERIVDMLSGEQLPRIC